MATMGKASGYQNLPSGNWAPAIYSQKVQKFFRRASVVEDITNNRLIITSQDKFVSGEVIVGTSSGAQANITNYKPNPVNNIVDLVNFRDPDNVISYFLTNMRDEFLATLPEQTAAGVDKRKLIKNGFNKSNK